MKTLQPILPYCKAAQGGACIGESWGAWATGGGGCQAAGGACDITESAYIGQERDCETYCNGKFPAEFELIQDNVDLTRQEILEGQMEINELIKENVDRTRQVLLEGQMDIKSNLDKLTESIATNNKDLKDHVDTNTKDIKDDIATNNEDLKDHIDTNNKDLKDELILAQAKLLYLSRAASNFYGTKIEI